MSHLENKKSPLELRTELQKMIVSNFAGFDLGYGFHKSAQGRRFTVSESARRDVLSRLLKLNHARWEEEQKQSALDGEKPKSKSGNKGKKSKSSDGQIGMF